MTFDPKLVKQGDGTSCQWQNCVAASIAMALSRHTLGKKSITPHRIRTYYGNYCPGIPYTTAVSAVKNIKGEQLYPRFQISWEIFKDGITAGRGAVAHIKYGRLLGTRFSSSSRFTGLHAIYVNDRRWSTKRRRYEFQVYDPLADGRYPWIPKGPQWWPAELLRDVMADTGAFHAVFTRETE